VYLPKCASPSPASQQFNNETLPPNRFELYNDANLIYIWTENRITLATAAWYWTRNSDGADRARWISSKHPPMSLPGMDSLHGTEAFLGCNGQFLSLQVRVIALKRFLFLFCLVFFWFVLEREESGWGNGIRNKKWLEFIQSNGVVNLPIPFKDGPDFTSVSLSDYTRNWPVNYLIWNYSMFVIGWNQKPLFFVWSWNIYLEATNFLILSQIDRNIHRAINTGDDLIIIETHFELNPPFIKLLTF